VVRRMGCGHCGPASVSVAVTETVYEFILGIDFLSEQHCLWDFSRSHILLREDWVPLRKCSAADECRHVSELSSPTGHAGGSPSIHHLTESVDQLREWMMEPTEVTEGVPMVRVLFGGKALQSTMHVICSGCTDPER